ISALLFVMAACGSVAPTPLASTSQPPSPGSAQTARPAPAEASTASDWQAEWEQRVAAAKQEGKISLLIQPGASIRQALDNFQTQYGIALDVRTGNGSPDLVPAVATERQAGKFLWDAAILNSQVLFTGFKPLGAFEPLRPSLIQPGVLDDSKWLGGFAAGWADHDKLLVYAFVHNQTPTAHVNRDIIPEAQLNTLDQLWDPKWKGKIAIGDPRTPSSGAGSLATILGVKGEDKLRALLRDQQLVLTQDRRQLFDWVLRGQYPIGIGISPDSFTDYLAQGVDVSKILPIVSDDPASFKLSHGSGAMAFFNHAPHPNAAVVFANWLLSQEGQQLYSQATGYNVRRLDVPVANPSSAIDPKRQYVELETEDTYPTQAKSSAIAKEFFK
ncbi:MAG TPA: extracellular solute-binding protein, partial [Chloroflexota bacterium]|nr:extracellular solute-binding protein [Chloroflexota bacterium]